MKFCLTARQGYGDVGVDPAGGRHANRILGNITMNVTENYKLPSGGPFNLSPKVSATILAHLEVLASPGRDHAKAADARDALIRSLDAREASFLQMVAGTLRSIGERREERILRDQRGVETRRQNSAVRRKKAA
jgi:hypothetical protein